MCVLAFGLARAADIVPPEIDMPGTQPQEVSMESPGRCLNCHQDYETNPRVEPGFGWMGAAMGNASSHSATNLPLLVAGGGLRHGQHLAHNPDNPPPLCSLWVSALQHLGLETDQFGSGTSTLPGIV